jgi:hypothetical protein
VLDQRSNIAPMPDGQAVERLAITMAAAIGLVWSSVEADHASRLRVMANAVLMRNLPETIPATPTAQSALDEAVQALRAGARGLEGIHEGLIQRLFRAAAKLEILSSVVSTEVDLGAEDELV